ncbi:unnamed protein product [Moneuplotes crassus]|uniref:Uncharacterized protein n=1 Tax=Euplotes crassus TaxID=5936 RepID=A0AAD1UJM7_EUPCR|nr:unnamed protein product [Moneuplotes crassus]
MGNCTASQANDSYVPAGRKKPLLSKPGKRKNKLYTNTNEKQALRDEDSNSFGSCSDYKCQGSSGGSGCYQKMKTNSSSFAANSSEQNFKRFRSLESTSGVQERSVSKNPTKDLLSECMKDHEKIDYDYCKMLISQCYSEKLLKEISPYTQESVLHYCCYRGHLDLIEALLKRQPKLVKLKDLNCNTAFHSLCKNITSSEHDLGAIFLKLKKYRINIASKNEDGRTGIDLLIQRIRQKNPYDGNLHSIRLLYGKVLDSIPVEYYNRIKSNKNFITKERLLETDLSDISSMKSISIATTAK